MINEIVVGFKDAVREPVVAHKLPDVFDRVEFGGFRRQGDDCDIGRHNETRRQMPARLVDQENSVCAGSNGLGDLHEMQVHRLGIAGGQDQGCTLALLRADGAEDVGGSSALVAGRTGTRAALRPPAGNLVLLTDTRFVREPDLYLVAVERFLAGDCIQAGGETFLKSSITPSTCAWWHGRAESLR